MLRQIDKIGELVIQKVTKPDGRLIRYQVIRADLIGKDSAIEMNTLKACRDYCGFQQPQAAE